MTNILPSEMHLFFAMQNVLLKKIELKALKTKLKLPSSIIKKINQCILRKFLAREKHLLFEKIKENKRC